MADESQLAERLRAILLQRSITFGDFVLSSGKTSSYYIDARRTTMSAEGLTIIGDLGLAALQRAGWRPEAVGGLTLGADPVAYAIARASADSSHPVDAFTVRKAAKDHGAKRQVEGADLANRAVVVVEDVISSGDSARQAIEAVTNAGAHVLGVLAVVDRQEGGRETLEAAGHEVVSFTTASELGLQPAS